MTSRPSRPVTGVDTHAHIFTRDLPMTSDRRYAPDYDATLDAYLAHLDAHGLSHGVLVQPSFLGTDNGYLLEALRRHPDRLRAFAVVDREISDEQLDVMHAAGVRGIRLNLIGRELENYAAAPWASFFERLAARGWLVEIQRGMEDLAMLLPAMLASGVTVVIDHFGLPPAAIDPQSPAHRAFLALLTHEPIWVKLSAAYRSKANPEQARAMFEALREACGGCERFVWGSDWPHTRFEDQTGYDSQFELLQRLLPDAEERRQVLIDNPARLFGLNA